MFARLSRLGFRITTTFIFGVLVSVGLMAAEPASAAHGEDVSPSPPPLVAPDGTRAMPAAELAYEVLALHKVLTGPLVDVQDVFAAMAGEDGASGLTPDLSIDYLLTFPDGTTMTVAIRSVAELDEFMEMVGGKFLELRPALKARLGRRPTEGRHDVRITGACVDYISAEGGATVTWNQNFFTIVSDNMNFTGVAVDDVVVMLCNRDAVPPLVGHWHDDRLHLQSAAVDCAIEIVRN